MTTLIRNPRAREGLGNFVLISLSVGIVILYSSYQRPFWTDELVQVQIASPATFTNWVAIPRQLFESDVSWWYSGYWFYSWLALPLGGAFEFRELYFRFPSYLSGFIVLVSAIGILRARGYAFAWQLLAILATGSQVFALYFMGEARTYVLLAAAVGVTTWVYAQRNPNLTGFQKAALLLAVTFGTLTHYFFIFYLLGIAALFYVGSPHYQHGKLKRMHLHPYFLAWVLILAGALNFRTFILGRSQTAGQYDPFQYTRPEGGVLSVWADTHLQFLPLPKAVSIAVAFGLLLIAVSLFFVSWVRRRSLSWAEDFLLSTLFTGLLLVIPLLISLLAVWAGFQILNRQWVSSLLLFPVGVVWMAASFYAGLPSRFRLPLRVGITLFGLTCAGMFAWRSLSQLQSLI